MSDRIGSGLIRTHVLRAGDEGFGSGLRARIHWLAVAQRSSHGGRRRGGGDKWRGLAARSRRDDITIVAVVLLCYCVVAMFGTTSDGWCWCCKKSGRREYGIWEGNRLEMEPLRVVVAAPRLYLRDSLRGPYPAYPAYDEVSSGVGGLVGLWCVRFSWGGGGQAQGLAALASVPPTERVGAKRENDSIQTSSG